MSAAKRKLTAVPERPQGQHRGTADGELSALIAATEALEEIEALWSEERDEDWSRVVGYLLSRHASLFDRARMIQDGEA